MNTLLTRLQQPRYLWLMVAGIKLVLFIYFNGQFRQNWPDERFFGGFFASGGDTPTYYTPLHDAVNGKGYTSVCRMPGLLPIYAPFGLIFPQETCYIIIVFIQFLTDIIATVLFIQSLLLLTGSVAVALLSGFLLALSSFTSVWVHYGLSDSFALSFLLLAFYFLMSFLKGQHGNSFTNKCLLYGGFFMAWSVFFRPVHLLIMVVFSFLILWYHRKNMMNAVKSVMVFILPFTISLSIWTCYNFNKTGRIIPLQDSMANCYTFYNTEKLAVRDLIIAWGYDFQYWRPSSMAEWYLARPYNGKKPFKFESRIFTSAYQQDSLFQLKLLYDRFTAEQDELIRTQTGSQLLSKCSMYLRAYKEEHAFDYYVINRIRLLKMFLFPSHLDDLPLPALADMNLIQKGIKAAYYLLLLAVLTLGTMGAFYNLLKGDFFSLIPLSMILVLGGLLGYIEQRYLVPCYPFLMYYMINLVFTINKFISKFLMQKKKQAAINFF